MGEQETSRSVENQDQPQDTQLSPDAEGDAQVAERGADSPESKSNERDLDQEVEDAKEEVKELEENPPEKLEDWPTGRAKYDDVRRSRARDLLRRGGHRQARSLGRPLPRGRTVTKDGEEVDNPDEFNGEPIPGGPTDPNSPSVAGEKDYTDSNEADDSEDAKDEE